MALEFYGQIKLEPRQQNKLMRDVLRQSEFRAKIREQELLFNTTCPWTYSSDLIILRKYLTDILDVERWLVFIITKIIRPLGI